MLFCWDMRGQCRDPDANQRPQEVFAAGRRRDKEAERSFLHLREMERRGLCPDEAEQN